jgi:hypothetical protein
MADLTVQEQRALGGEVSKLLGGLPAADRLLLLVACLYGEGRAQGLSAGDVVNFTDRICAIHAAGVLVQAAASRTCPLCGTPRGLG